MAESSAESTRPLSFLLLQARKQGDPMAAHEQECFADALGATTEQVQSLDLITAVPSPEQLEQTDMLLVGGSGSYSTLDDAPWITRFFDFVDAQVLGRGIPTFASCFGFQALIRVGGGTMIADPPNTEVGTFAITLTEAGCADPLLGRYAPGFEAQLGHKDRATQLPSGMQHLASSERAPFQALRVEGLPIFATQFHPELDMEGNVHRYTNYRAGYAGSAADDDDAVLSNMRPSPEASSLLRLWVAELQETEAVRTP